MKNGNIKKLIFFAIIILITILILTVIAIFQMQILGSQKAGTKEDDTDKNIIENYGKTENGGIDKQAYYDIKTCMEKYLNTINIKNNKYEDDEQYLQDSELKQKIYNLLSQKYINEKNITINNVYDYIKVFKESVVFVPVEISMIQDSKIKSFIVYGLIESKKEFEVIEKIYAIININLDKNEFSIEPIYGDYNSIHDITFEKYEESIISNANNTFNVVQISEEDIASEYIERYKRLALGYPEKVYKLLDEEYKNIKFGSLENFIKYIEKNEEEIKYSSLQKHQVNTYNNEVYYMCLDQNENYYIFKETNDFLNYNLILDTYTVDLPEFIQKYINTSALKKVGMNVSKVFSAIKDEDYKYIYSKLDNTFKTNKFPTEKHLEDYIKNNLPITNNIEHIKTSQDSGVFFCKSKIGEKTFNVIMQLGEGTTFTMSFSVE